jgi:hypothetical protein
VGGKEGRLGGFWQNRHPLPSNRTETGEGEELTERPARLVSVIGVPGSAALGE